MLRDLERRIFDNKEDLDYYLIEDIFSYAVYYLHSSLSQLPPRDDGFDNTSDF
jgi:hypothetical protein